MDATDVGTARSQAVGGVTTPSSNDPNDVKAYQLAMMIADTAVIAAAIVADGGSGTLGITQLTGPVTAGPGVGVQGTTITDHAVTLAKIQLLAANSILGNNTGSPATAIQLTVSETKALLAITSDDVSTPVVGAGTSVNTVTEFMNNAWSAGVRYDGCVITDNGDGTVNITTGETMLRTDIQADSPLKLFTIPAVTNFALTDHAANYIYADYNSGTVAVHVTTDLAGFNCRTTCIMYMVTREGTDLAIIDARGQNQDSNVKHRRMLLECDPLRHARGGSVIGNPSGLYISLTAGKFYFGLAAISHGAFDTSVAGTANANIFRYYYRSGGGWTYTPNSKQIDTNNYDNGSGTLQPLTKHGLAWVYLILDTTTPHLAVVYGQGNYTTEELATTGAPASLPPQISSSGVLVGKITFDSGASTFLSVNSPFTQVISASIVTDHNDLGGIQGGQANEYYHLTNTEHGIFGNMATVPNNTKEPTGFIPTDVSTVGFVDGTRTFTITPTGTLILYQAGIVTAINTARSIVISNVEGMHFIYFDGQTLYEAVNPTASTIQNIILQYPYVANLYWDATNGKQIWLGEERHGSVMDGETHLYLHRTRGMQLQSGGDLGNFVADATGSLDSHAQFSIAESVVHDEDIRIDQTARLSTATIPVYYRSGADASNIWRVTETGTFGVLPTGTGRAAYNQNNAGTWQLTECNNLYFVLAHVFVGNDTTRKFGVIMGQAQYSTVAAARAAANTELATLVTAGLPMQEAKFLGTVIYETATSYGNTVKSRVRTIDGGTTNYIDWRTALFPSAGASGSVTDHATLANLDYASAGHTGFVASALLHAASGVATLDANSRLVEVANQLWDGTAGRSASPNPGNDQIPVLSAAGALNLPGNVYLTNNKPVYYGDSTAYPRVVIDWNGSNIIWFGNVDRAHTGYIQLSGTSASALHFISQDGTDNTVWHSGNDGATSGLDADLLDGNHAAAFEAAGAAATVQGNLNTHIGLTGTSVHGLGSISTLSSIALSNMDNLAANSIIGNNTGTPATPIALTVTQVKALLAYTLASADFVNQGTATTLLHGNAAGNPSWAAVALGDMGLIAANSILGNNTGATHIPIELTAANVKAMLSYTLASSDFANQGTTTTVLHGNAAGNPSFGSVALGDMASLAAYSFIGNNTGSSAVPIAMTVAQSLTLLGIKPLVYDWGSRGASFGLDLSYGELHIVSCTAAITITISSTFTNDKATVVIKNGANAITLAGIDTDSPTLTNGASKQDFIGLVKSFGKITCVASDLNKATV